MLSSWQIYTPKFDMTLIGATFLESAGLAPDPVRRRLVPVDLLMM
jgi:hypothetical protein